MARKRLGDVLRDRKHISAADLERALEEQQKHAALLGELLLSRNMVSHEQLISALEEVTHVPYVDARVAKVDPSLLKLIPRASAMKLCVLPLHREGRKIAVVMEQPHNLSVMDELRFLTGTDVAARFGLRSEIRQAIEKNYANEERSAKRTSSLPLDDEGLNHMQFLTASSTERNKAAIREFQAEMRNEKTPAVRLVSGILYAAVTKGASDIHIEPNPTGCMVRVRVDGVLRELSQIPLEIVPFIISRVKILSDMDIAERRTPQDGRFLIQLADRRLDIRVSTLPTHEGEKVVMRLLEPNAGRVGFEAFGLSRPNAQELMQLLKSPQGMILVTGPTGSGKSTTLYTALNVVRSKAVNIITVEDPVEYKVEGINQVQVNTKVGLTFANCLRSILRQDPNIIMVGEIRDQDTAEIALQASQTGHLVLSTLHTNDSISAINRLLDLDIPAFMIAASVTAVVAQRLVRKLCDCKEQTQISSEFAARLAAAGITDYNERVCIPRGCSHCDDTGYRGRVGIYELLVVNEQIRNAIRAGCPDHEIRNMARSNNMKMLNEDALDKVGAGITSLEEVMRVVPFEHTAATLRCIACSKVLAPTFSFCPYCGTSARGVTNAVAVTTA